MAHVVARFSSRRWPAAIAFGVMLIPALALDASVFLHGGLLLSDLFVPLLLAFFTLGPILGLLSPLTAQRSTIVVDSEGVDVLKDGRRIRYDFRDLDAIRTPVVDQRSQTRIVKLVRKGELTDRKGPVGGLYGAFGADATQIAATLQAARDRWADERGSGPAAPSAAP